VRRGIGTQTEQLSHAALRCPSYCENSHASHTWHQPSHESACFLVPEAASPWVRFPSPVPLFVPGVSLRCPRTRFRASPGSHTQSRRGCSSFDRMRRSVSWSSSFSMASSVRHRPVAVDVSVGFAASDPRPWNRIVRHHRFIQVQVIHPLPSAQKNTQCPSRES
jgi:hypothetical protein